MFFFKLFESPNLAQKLHVEEWIPTLNDALMIAMQLGIIVIILGLGVLFLTYSANELLTIGQIKLYRFRTPDRIAEYKHYGLLK